MKLKSYLGIALLTVSALVQIGLRAGGMPVSPWGPGIIIERNDKLTIDEYRYLLDFIPYDATDAYIGKMHSGLYLKVMPPIPVQCSYFVLYSTGNGIYQACMGYRGLMKKQRSVYYGLVEMRPNGKIKFIDEDTHTSFIFANNSEDHKGSYVSGNTEYPVFVTHVTWR